MIHAILLYLTGNALQSSMGSDKSIIHTKVYHEQHGWEVPRDENYGNVINILGLKRNY